MLCNWEGKRRSSIASWPCITNSVVYSPTGLTAIEREMSTWLTLHSGMHPLLIIVDFRVLHHFIVRHLITRQLIGDSSSDDGSSQLVNWNDS